MLDALCKETKLYLTYGNNYLLGIQSNKGVK